MAVCFSTIKSGENFISDCSFDQLSCLCFFSMKQETNSCWAHSQSILAISIYRYVSSDASILENHPLMKQLVKFHMYQKIIAQTSDGNKYKKLYTRLICWLNAMTTLTASRSGQISFKLKCHCGCSTSLPSHFWLSWPQIIWSNHACILHECHWSR